MDPITFVKGLNPSNMSRPTFREANGIYHRHIMFHFSFCSLGSSIWFLHDLYLAPQVVWFQLVWFSLIFFFFFCYDWFGLVFGLAWYCLIQIDLVWICSLDLVWFSLVRFGLVWFGLDWFLIIPFLFVVSFCFWLWCYFVWFDLLLEKLSMFYVSAL